MVDLPDPDLPTIQVVFWGAIDKVRFFNASLDGREGYANETYS